MFKRDRWSSAMTVSFGVCCPDTGERVSQGEG